MVTPETIIAELKLSPLTIEGGYFSETYRSTVMSGDGRRCCGTCIYYLLRRGQQSAWHRVASDEIWLYHGGTAAIQLLLFPDGHHEERTIGGDVAKGERPQSIIPAGVWQAAGLIPEQGDWGLFSAVVFPGFEYADYVSGDGAELAVVYPGIADRMRELGLAT